MTGCEESPLDDVVPDEWSPFEAVLARSFSASFLLELDSLFLLFATADEVRAVSFFGFGHPHVCWLLNFCQKCVILHEAGLVTLTEFENSLRPALNVSW